MKPLELIPKFDIYLEKVGLKFEAVVVGATALNLSGVVTRETVDCDILDPKIPPEIMQAALEFAKQESLPESSLKEAWLNNGPADLIRDLPDEWRMRLVLVFKGNALQLYTLGRPDLLLTKLFAFCDRGTDLKDCIAMKPSRDELLNSFKWVSARDANPKWPAHVKESFRNLSQRLGYEF